jgi:HK97 gp10 family phage protein
MSKPRVEMKTEGIPELVGQFKGIINSVVGAVVEAALSGGQVIADRANQNLNRGEVVQTKINSGQTTKTQAAVDIGLIKEKWFYRWFELGASRHEITPLDVEAIKFALGSDEFFSMGHVSGGQPANPFIRPAIDESRQEVLKKMAEVYNRAILSNVKK